MWCYGLIQMTNSERMSVEVRERVLDFCWKGRATSFEQNGASTGTDTTARAQPNPKLRNSAAF
jgi:hypothetical protein